MSSYGPSYDARINLHDTQSYNIESNKGDVPDM